MDFGGASHFHPCTSFLPSAAYPYLCLYMDSDSLFVKKPHGFLCPKLSTLLSGTLSMFLKHPYSYLKQCPWCLILVKSQRYYVKYSSESKSFNAGICSKGTKYPAKSISKVQLQWQLICFRRSMIFVFSLLFCENIIVLKKVVTNLTNWYYNICGFYMLTWKLCADADFSFCRNFAWLSVSFSFISLTQIS